LIGGVKIVGAEEILEVVCASAELLTAMNLKLMSRIAVIVVRI
jgi:hypothetical protein